MPDDWTPAQAGSAPVGVRTAPADDVTVRVDLGRVTRVLWIAVGVLVALDFLMAVAAAYTLLPDVIIRFFDGDRKVNFPTGGKTTLLLLNTLLMLACWTAGRRSNDPGARGWALLSAVTAFAFIDETTYLHQSLSEALQKAFDLTGVLKYAWTIVYFPAVVVVAVFLARNLRIMHPDVRRRVLPGGALFVLGALAMEPVKSNLSSSPGGDLKLGFRLTAAVSDSLELTGLTVLAAALLLVLSRTTSRFSFALDAGPSAAQGSPQQQGAGQFAPQEQYAAQQHYAAQQAAQQHHAAQQYAADPYAAQQYPAGQQYPAAQQYPADPYAGQQYAGQQYADQPAGQQQYPGQQYADQPAGQQQYPGQQYADPQYAGQRYPEQQYADQQYPESIQLDQPQYAAQPSAGGQQADPAAPDDDPLWAPTRRRPTSGGGW